ncbi:hypothetical protein M2156_004815 [Streptomyces sp. SAI-149]|nr:hypothetical protein [Streptomyces sp. SAI-149]
MPVVDAARTLPLVPTTPTPGPLTRPSVLDLLDTPGGRTSACPGCREFAPGWTRVDIDGLSVLTHDGDVICPSDPSFGYSVCEDCDGTETVLDDDGSVSGTPGLVIPCVCSDIAFPVEIGPEDEPMPGYRAQTFTPVADTPAAVAA